MGDIKCRICGEPWEECGLSDSMNRLEVEKFRKGTGCPCCGFGKLCPNCGGSGKERLFDSDSCSECGSSDRGTVSVCRLLRPPIGQGKGSRPLYDTWMIIYNGPMRPFPGEPKLIGKTEQSETRDGLAEYGCARCPECWESLPVCPRCKGTGEYRGQFHDEAFFSSILMESEDPGRYLF